MPQEAASGSVLQEQNSEPEKLLAPGVVIGVNRGLYDHYGILVEDTQVIHYTGEDSDMTGEVRIKSTSIEQFLKGETHFWMLHIPTKAALRRTLERRWESVLHRLKQQGINVPSPLVSVAVDFFLKGYVLCTPEDTVERAVSRLGEKQYNIALRNCEHFAIWCKTGMSASTQVEGLMYGGASLLSALLCGVKSVFPTEADDVLLPINKNGDALFVKSDLIPASSLA